MNSLVSLWCQNGDRLADVKSSGMYAPACTIYAGATKAELPPLARAHPSVFGCLM